MFLGPVRPVVSRPGRRLNEAKEAVFPRDFVLHSSGANDAFVAKLLDNRTIWAVALGGPYTDYGADVAVSSVVLVTGTFEYEMGNLTSMGGSDMFVAGLSVTSGDVEWMVAYGTFMDDFGSSVTADGSATSSAFLEPPHPI